MLLIFVTVPNNSGAAMPNDSKLSQTVTVILKAPQNVFNPLSTSVALI